MNLRHPDFRVSTECRSWMEMILWQTSLATGGAETQKVHFRQFEMITIRIAQSAIRQQFAQYVKSVLFESFVLPPVA